jgi:hypothetical protein
MSALRTWGVALLAVAGVLWAVVVGAVFLTPVEEGANTGAGMLFLLAVPCTVTGLSLLLAGRHGPSPAPWAAPPGFPQPGGTLLAEPVAAPAYGNAPAGWGLALAICGFLLVWMPMGGSEAAIYTGVAIGAALSLAGAGLGWQALCRVRAGRATNRGQALAAVIVGLTGVGQQAFVLLELVLYLLWASA